MLPSKESSLSLGRVTTDAVHRRFCGGKNTKSDEKNQSDQNEYYYCQQCHQTFPVSPRKEELKTHFETVKHNQYSTCVYCSKPVYIYKYKKKLEVYHVCRYD